MGIDVAQQPSDQEDASPSSPASTGCSINTEHPVAAKPHRPPVPAEGPKKWSSGEPDVTERHVRKARCLLARYNVDWRTVDLATVTPLPTYRTKSGYHGAYPARGRRWQAQLKHRTLGAYSSPWLAGCAVTRALVRLARVDCFPDSYDSDPNSSPDFFTACVRDDPLRGGIYSLVGQLEPCVGGVPATISLPNSAAFVGQALPPPQQVAAYPNDHGTRDPTSQQWSCGASLRTLGPPSATWCCPSQSTAHFSAGPPFGLQQPTHSPLFSTQQMPCMPMEGVPVQAAQTPGPHCQGQFPAPTDSMPITNGMTAATKACAYSPYWSPLAPYQLERVHQSPTLPWQGVISDAPEHPQHSTKKCGPCSLPSCPPAPSASYSTCLQQSMHQSSPQQPMHQPMPPLAIPQPQSVPPQSMMPPQSMQQPRLPLAASMPPHAMMPQSVPQQPPMLPPTPQPPMHQKNLMPPSSLPPQPMSQPLMPPQPMPREFIPPAGGTMTPRHTF